VMIVRQGMVRCNVTGAGVDAAAAVYHGSIAQGFVPQLVLMILTVTPRAVTGAGR
jgi:hypothetical protein